MNAGPTTNTILSYLNSSADAGIGLQDNKDASGLDWYVEGPGRRVGYDNLTAIDWIYEYSKERMRLQHLLRNAPGLFGQLRVLADSSQIWLILIATGIAVGGIAAGIDVASDWMGDLKTGVCSNVDNGGKFYLNKTFCCWGEDSMAECKDWRSWGALMGIGNNAGGYIIEYIVFILFSVSHPLEPKHLIAMLIRLQDLFRNARLLSCCALLALRKTVWYSRDQDCPRWLCYPALPGSMDSGHQIYWSLPCCRVWNVARKRRSARACRLLLRQPVHEAFPQRQRQRSAKA